MKTSSGATAVQIVYSYHRGSRKIEHIGSAHHDAEVELLKAVARQRLGAGQGVLDLGPGFSGGDGGPLPITASRMGCLLDALGRGHDVLGLGRAAGGDAAFRDLVLARIIEPVSKMDSLRVLEAAGLSFVLGMKIPHVPYAVAQWRREHPGEDIPDGHIFTQPWPAGPNGGRHDQPGHLP